MSAHRPGISVIFSVPSKAPAAWLACLALSLVSVNCVDAPPRHSQNSRAHALPIVRGQAASISEFPYVVAITDRYAEPFCTGTLVSPRVVLTAGHCLFDWAGALRSSSQMRVVVGYTTPSQAPPNDRLMVRSVVPHPSYAPSAPVDDDGFGALRDVGLVVLWDAVQDTAPAPILPAGRVDAALRPGAPIQIAGFGVSDLDSYEMGALFQATTPMIRRTDREFLAGKPGYPDSCTGDSGGPAFVRLHGQRWLVGVTSRGWLHSVIECGDGGIYTLAPSYQEWIEAVIEAQRPDAGADGDAFETNAEASEAATDGPVEAAGGSGGVAGQQAEPSVVVEAGSREHVVAVGGCAVSSTRRGSVGGGWLLLLAAGAFWSRTARCRTGPCVISGDRGPNRT